MTGYLMQVSVDAIPRVPLHFADAHCANMDARGALQAAHLR